MTGVTKFHTTKVLYTYMCGLACTLALEQFIGMHTMMKSEIMTSARVAEYLTTDSVEAFPYTVSGCRSSPGLCTEYAWYAITISMTWS